MLLRGWQQEVAQLRSPMTVGAWVSPLMDKSARPEKLTGHDCVNWAEDFVTTLGSKRPGLPQALKWAKDQGETQLRPEDALAFLVDEPRSKASPRNGLRAWRRLKVRYNPARSSAQARLNF